MLEQTVQIISNERDTDLYFRLVVRAPKIAPRVAPGQFAHIRILPLKEALLRRPFSIYQVAGDTFSILYKAVGKGTEALSRMRPGEELSALGPLGHGFTVPPPGGETPMLVAGGYGMAAMYLLAQRSPQKGIVFVGGRRRVDILCELEFRVFGWDVRVIIEDGSHDKKKLVTHPLIAELRRTVIWPSPPSKPPSSLGELTERGVGGGRGPQNDARRKIFACGPTPMLKAVGKIAEEFNVPAELSMDEHMCCGVGVCLTCVIPVKTDEGWEYQRTCTEGPVFDSRQIVWESSK